MTPLVLLTGLALAADLDRFPVMATVDVPACDDCAPGEHVVRIPVPPALRTPEDPDGATDLQLVDAEGRVVPVAVARGQGPPEPVTVRDMPERGGDVWTIDAVDRPLDGLTVHLRAEPTAADITVEERTPEGWAPLVTGARVWRHALGDHEAVALPPTRGPLRVTVTARGGRWGAPVTRIDGFRHRAADLPRVDLRLPVVASQLDEDGWSRHVVPLPAALPIQAVTLHPEGDLFERQVALDGGERLPYGAPDVAGVIHRIDLGGAQVDLTTVDAPRELRSDTLVVRVREDADAPLELPEVTVHLEGLELLVRDPPAGPLTLYGGAAPGTSALHDLSIAVPELRRMADAVALVEEVTPNPAWRTPEARSGLSDPGPPLDLSRYRWRRPVTGAPGLVRIPLTEDVVAEGEPTWRDLRLVTADGAQVPRVVRRAPLDRDWGALEFTRTEDGARSILRARLPAADVPVATVTIRTPALLFEREVTVNRVEGGVLAPVRARTWVGVDHPTALALTLDAPMGEELVIALDNGDDPPLPVDAIEVTWPGWEILAVLPDAPVALVGGDPDGAPPSYDLALLTEDLGRRAAATAALGPREELAPPPPGPAERMLLLAGLGVLVVGLGLLTVRLVRAVPDDTPDPTAAGSG